MKEYYKKDVFENIVRESDSIAEVIRKIGLRVAGGNFNTISKYIQLYNIDTSHFSGQTWNKGMGLYQSSSGKLLNADVNGALNIMRKSSW